MKKDHIDRFIALFNAGCGPEMEPELIDRGRMESLLEELKAAQKDRDFKRIDSCSVHESCRCKRTGDGLWDLYGRQPGAWHAGLP